MLKNTLLAGLLMGWTATSMCVQDLPGRTIKQDTLRHGLHESLIDKVTKERMNKGLVVHPLDALSGQAAGVSVGSSTTNPLAMLSSVRVRGTTSLTGGNDPLVIIDGVSSDLATLSSIYPGDIESFSILKNAAETALYGSRGASGVIVVTTQKGKNNRFHISYDANVAVQDVYKTLHMLDAESYLGTANLLGLPANNGGDDVDYQRAITRTGWIQNHHLAFSGGTTQSNYRASIGFMDDKAVVRTNGRQNLVAKVDLQQHAFENHLTVDMGVFGSSQKSNDLFDSQKLFYSTAAMNPTLPSGQNASGGWNRNADASQIDPPMALLNMKNDMTHLQFNAHLQLTIRLLKNLDLKAFGSYSYSSQENAQFCPTWVWAQGQAYRGESKSESLLGNIAADYRYQHGVHRLDATILGEYQKERKQGFWTLVKGFTSNAFGYDNLGAGSIRPQGSTGSSYEAPSLASVMGNVSYTLSDRYKLSISGRGDGSSMVGEGHKWGFFPSVSAEWDLKREAFLRDKSHLSSLRLRTGYGLAGNLGGISSYYTLPLMEPNSSVPAFGSPIVTMAYMRNINPDLTWETRSTFNIGVNCGLLSDRVVLTAEYYYSKTTNMLYLYDVPVPPFTYDKMLANLGSMSNSGVEIGLSLTPIRRKDMDLNININLTCQQNKLISLSGNLQGHELNAPDYVSIGQLNGAGFHGGNNNIVYQMVGQPLGVFYLPHCTGLEQNDDGTYYYRIEDRNHDGKDDTDDRYIAGQATPKMTLGSNFSFRYKNIDIALQVNGAFGHKIYNGTSLTYMNMGGFPTYNVMEQAPKQNINDQVATDYWLEKGNYVNFDYLTVGWNVPLHSRYVSALRLSCSINNLGTITGYSGLSPMINSYVVDSTLGIDDKRSYPIHRSYAIGASIQF